MRYQLRRTAELIVRGFQGIAKTAPVSLVGGDCIGGEGGGGDCIKSGGTSVVGIIQTVVEATRGGNLGAGVIQTRAQDGGARVSVLTSKASVLTSNTCVLMVETSTLFVAEPNICVISISNRSSTKITVCQWNLTVRKITAKVTTRV